MGLDRLKGHFLGAAVGDYDNDGYDDLYLTAYRGGALLHNEKGKGFQDVTAQAGIKPQPWGTSAAFADVDGSGRLGLFIGNYASLRPAHRPAALQDVREDDRLRPALLPAGARASCIATWAAASSRT